VLVLYNPEDESEHTFIPRVQDIVKSLYEISQEIPSDSVTDVYNLGRDQSLRTTASLHLMLFQVCESLTQKNNYTNHRIGDHTYDSSNYAACRETHPQWTRPYGRAAARFTTRQTLANMCRSCKTSAQSSCYTEKAKHDRLVNY
jgi:hypothetical protein